MCLYKKVDKKQLNPTSVHWERLLKSVSNLNYAKHYYRRKPEGPSGVKRFGRLWKIWKYTFPGQPFTKNWVKSKTIIEKHKKKQGEKILFKVNFHVFFHGVCFYSILGWWLTWKYMFLDYPNCAQSFSTLGSPGSLSTVVSNTFKQFLPQYS